MADKDMPTERFEKDILDSTSEVYASEHLWTYGFIRALLEYCSLEENQHARMIRFEDTTSFHVDKCDLKTVSAVRDKMEREKKDLPFFILDEMTPNVDMVADARGIHMAAFQRNVFCACGLVVVVMGTDAKITNLVDQAGGSYKKEHMWFLVSLPINILHLRRKRNKMLEIESRGSILL